MLSAEVSVKSRRAAENDDVAECDGPKPSNDIGFAVHLWQKAFPLIALEEHNLDCDKPPSRLIMFGVYSGALWLHAHGQTINQTNIKRAFEIHPTTVKKYLSLLTTYGLLVEVKGVKGPEKPFRPTFEASPMDVSEMPAD